MTKYQIAFFDIDGTLVDNHADRNTYYEGVPESARVALKLLKNAGVEPVIASGRGSTNLLKLAEKLGIDSVIACNGQHIIYKGKEIYQSFMDQTMIEQVYERFSARNIPVLYEMLDGIYALPGYHDDVQRKIPLNYLKSGAMPENVLQLIVHGTDFSAFQAELPELKVAKSGPEVANILPWEVSKGSGITRLLDILGIPVEASLAFGDEENDLEMFDVVGTSVAMGNAVNRLKRRADFITREVWNDGIHYACEELRLIPLACETGAIE